MRIYVNKRKELILAPEYFEKYGGVSNETMQIKDGEFAKEIEKRSQTKLCKRLLSVGNLKLKNYRLKHYSPKDKGKLKTLVILKQC